ncbi:mRNA-capping enzyme-like protein [Drosera capensis]
MVDVVLGAMDLNASPLPEEDEEVYGSHYREEFAAAQEHVESGVETYRRDPTAERGHTNDKPAQRNQRLSYDDMANFKKSRLDKSKLPPGWLGCPNFGQEIYYILPSKVPLGERFNDAVPPGKRYSSKQVFCHFNTGKILKLIKGVGVVLFLLNRGCVVCLIEGRYAAARLVFTVLPLSADIVAFLGLVNPCRPASFGLIPTVVVVKGATMGSDAPVAVVRRMSPSMIILGAAQAIWEIKHRKTTTMIEELGMVVDLTNTDRYYYPNEFTNKNVKHLKIQCQGRDSVPDNASVNIFFFEVRQFFQYQKAAKSYVLVHCTHGHNRTGYMIVHYLIRTMPISVSDAIQKFAEARPPGIMERSIDLNFGVVPDDDGDGVLADPTNEPHEASLVMDNDDLLGDEIPLGQEEDLRRDCYQLLKLKAASNFPGRILFLLIVDVNVPFGFVVCRVNLQLLRQCYYYATWKADGTRYMMLITFDGCYLIDRSFRFRRVQMRLPCRTAIEGQYGFHHYTLLDGEMIIDKVDDKEEARRYLIYDLLALNRTSVVEFPFYERWKLLEKEVVEPRNLERGIITEYWNREDSERRLIEQERAEQNINFHYRYDMEEFRVRRKDFWPLSTAPKILKKFIPTLSHQSDGLVFQGWDDPYVARTHQGLLKWKYPHMNSVDSLFKIENNNEHLYLFEGGREKLLEGNTVVFKGGTDPNLCKDKIIECSWDSEEHTWVYMRTRFDKSTPNEFNTYKKVLKSIMDNITEGALLNEIEEIVCLPMYADRISHPK